MVKRAAGQRIRDAVLDYLSVVTASGSWVRATQAELARAAGTVPASAAKVIAALRAEGLIESRACTSPVPRGPCVEWRITDSGCREVLATRAARPRGRGRSRPSHLPCQQATYREIGTRRGEALQR